jgi:CBS domain-containing protein
MHSVAELLRLKGNQVHTTTPDATALAAARKMNDHRIGSLVVTEGIRVAGIVTERDMLTRIVAGERPPASTRVEHIMTRGVMTCSPETHIDELRKLMHERRIRHVPVLDKGKLVGMISIGDLNAAETRTLVETVGYLEAYITS